MRKRPLAGYKRYVMKGGYAEEVRFQGEGQQAVRRFIARETGRLLEKALLDGFNTDAPIFIDAEAERDIFRDSVDITVSLDVLERFEPGNMLTPGAESGTLNLPVQSTPHKELD